MFPWCARQLCFDCRGLSASTPLRHRGVLLRGLASAEELIGAGCRAPGTCWSSSGGAGGGGGGGGGGRGGCTDAPPRVLAGCRAMMAASHPVAASTLPVPPAGSTGAGVPTEGEREEDEDEE
mmetsp:Transcript_63746/g.181050  ORF Transcript_63746/g.181050 Transcript_63746/m.181050 type:complete len:122 (+) Transcript_63746:89-454(+)